MFCKNCGAEMDASSAFCMKCGQKNEFARTVEETVNLNAAPAETVPPPPPPPSPQRVQAAQPIPPVAQAPAPPPPAPVYQPAYQTPPPMPPAVPAAPKPKKKRHIGLWIFLAIFALLTGSIIYAIGSLAWFGPKDLGIRYTQADTNRAIQAVGIHITADLGDGIKYDNEKALEGDLQDTGLTGTTKKPSEVAKKLDSKDYNYKFSKYEKKKVVLTSEEATAFANEVTTPFLWFEDIQIKVEDDGSIATSSRAYVETILSTIFPEAAELIPIPLPEKMNIYTVGFLTAQNDVFNLKYKFAKAGIFTLPDQYNTPENIDKFASYFKRFYLFSEANKMRLISMAVVDGKLVFEAYLPTEVQITPKAD